MEALGFLESFLPRNLWEFLPYEFTVSTKISGKPFTGERYIVIPRRRWCQIRTSLPSVEVGRRRTSDDGSTVGPTPASRVYWTYPTPSRVLPRPPQNLYKGPGCWNDSCPDDFGRTMTRNSQTGRYHRSRVTQ